MTDIYHYDWLNIHAGDNFNEPIRYSTDLALRSISLANLKYFKKNFSIYFTRNANLQLRAGIKKTLCLEIRYRILVRPA